VLNASTASFDRLWSALASIGHNAETGGYRRFAWTSDDALLREWFADEASARGLDLATDRAGNQWAWWGDPDSAAAVGKPGVAIGSHLDSVPDGGAFDGPLGVVSAFAAMDSLRESGFQPDRPVGVVNFVDEEGARFGIACAGSRLITGALSPDRARSLRDVDGVNMAEAMSSAGIRADNVGRDDETLRRIGVFVELHIEQGRGLVHLNAPLGVGSSIWPHGRWRVELPGEANHAGTTRLTDRRDPMLGYARLVLAAREEAINHNVVATCGKVQVEPNAVNAIPSLVTAWVDARGPADSNVRQAIDELSALTRIEGGTVVEESWTGETTFDANLRDRLGKRLGDVPVLATGAGHDAGILANAGIPTGMIFVRNPSGVSHSPAEFAERNDCLAGVEALAVAIEELTS
jgi:N-carbamoyl-L-amino-acid hydrolase